MIISYQKFGLRWKIGYFCCGYSRYTFYSIQKCIALTNSAIKIVRFTTTRLCRTFEIRPIIIYGIGCRLRPNIRDFGVMPCRSPLRSYAHLITSSIKLRLPVMITRLGHKRITSVQKIPRRIYAGKSLFQSSFLLRFRIQIITTGNSNEYP